MAIPPMTEPTAIPALAPVDRPDDVDDVESEPDAEDDEDDELEPAAVAVAAEVAAEVVVVSESKVAAVTLKQGTDVSKSSDSTKVYSVSCLFVRIYSGNGKCTHNIRTGVKGLVPFVVLALVDAPVLQLDGGVVAGADRGGNVVNQVALVAGSDLGDVVDDLLVERGLCRGVCTVSICNIV